MYRLTNRKTITVTVKLAKEWEPLNTYEAQRNFRKAKCDFLVEKIHTNKFRTGSIAFAKDKTTGRVVIVNGQHQIAAVIKSNKPICAVVEYYDCDGSRDAADLYAEFDNSGIRTIGDLVKARMHAVGLQWNGRVANLISTGARYIIEQGIHNGVSAKTREDQAKLIEHYQEEGDFVNELISNCEIVPAHLKRGPVIGIILATFRAHPKEAIKFWQAVRDGENLSRKDPAYKLREYLKANPIHGGHTQRKETLVKCIHAWNAFYRGESTMLKYHEGKAAPKIA